MILAIVFSWIFLSIPTALGLGFILGQLSKDTATVVQADFANHRIEEDVEIEQAS